MTATGFDLLSWLVPALVVLGSAAVLVVVVRVAVRRLRRGARARGRAQLAVESAGAALLHLDEAVDELDLEVGLSGALYGGDALASLRRARMTAQHTRDDGFAEFRAFDDPAAVPAVTRRAARDLTGRIERVLQAVDAARREHRAWIDAHVTAPEQIAAADRRLAELRSRMGDPAGLLRELAHRVDADEWAVAARAAEEAESSADEAAAAIARAHALAPDRSRAALDELAAAERALRRADAASRTIEETHRLVTQAGLAVADEIAAARAAIRSAASLHASLPADEADRLGAEVVWARKEIERIEPTATRRPVSANEAIARVRERLDLALGDAPTAQQRVRGARSALPGTLAAARSAIARAEAAVPPPAGGLDTRVRLDAARQDLASARQMQDPVAALDAARRAIRHADDAAAEAGPDRRGRSDAPGTSADPAPDPA
ncbi:hypothetical protein [Microbacterium sp. NPDC096154]|uniref:hypothetical protein n=1 Tax=Microbacterium sp. NPDC096154 TaxID=3155549 RepID=UPI0033212FEE